MRTLRKQIRRLADQHGSLRAAARAVNIDPGYLLRLRDGEKSEPSAAILRKLGLMRVVYYQPLSSRKAGSK